MRPFNSPLVKKLVALALEEDLVFGDLTSNLLEPELQKTAHIVAKQDLLVCGMDLVPIIVESANSSIKLTKKVEDGTQVKAGTVLIDLQGLACEITSLERTFLNFLQRMCGVATYTRAVVDQCAGIVLLDTRKTMPGFRILDKYATSVGGAKNHRMHLADMILIKNNHIDAAPGENIKDRVRHVLNKVKEKSNFYTPVQVEVRSFEELESALDYSPYAVLFDNMSDELMRTCISIVKKKSPSTICEASGGITAARLKVLAEIGVHAASMGALTTQAQNVDISLRMQAST